MYKRASVALNLNELLQTFLSLYRMYKPGWHEVVVVEHFHKGLYLGPFGNLLLAHSCCDFARITVDACDQSVAVRTVCGAVINVLKGGIKRAKDCQYINTQCNPSSHLSLKMDRY